VSARNVVNVLTVVIWIVALSLLIWFCVIQFKRLQSSAVVTSQLEKPTTLQYPGMFMCPSTETVNKGTARSYVISSPLGALFEPFKPYDSDDSDHGYTVCPRTVFFETPDGKTVGCLDFQPFPVFNVSVTDSTDDFKLCPTVNEEAYWFKSATTVPDPIGGAWAAARSGSSLYFDLTSYNITNEPYLVMLYSPASMSTPPQTVQQWISIYTITNFFLTYIPIQSDAAMDVDKIITDNWPMDDDCNYENFLASVITLAPPGAVGPDGFRASGLFLGYNILEVLQTCHSPVVGATDVLGIVGGGIAFVLAATILLQIGVQKAFGEKEQSSGNAQSSTYRPLGSDQ